MRHIFIKCPNVHKFWDATWLNNLIRRIITNQETDWLESLFNEKTTINNYPQWNQVLPFYLWNIWLVRNDNYHNKKSVDINSKAPYIQAMEYFSLTNQRTLRPKIVITYVKWKPPNTKFKINTDDSAEGNTGKGGVIRDKDGNCIVGFMAELFLNNLCHGRTGSFSEMSIAHNLTPLEISIDCEEIIRYLKDDHPSYSNILSNCGDLIWRNPLVQHSYHKENQAADSLANEDTKLIMINSFLLWVVPPLFADKAGTLFARRIQPNSISKYCNQPSTPTLFPVYILALVMLCCHSLVLIYIKL